MATNQDAHDLLDTLLDRINAMSPDELAKLREAAAEIDFDPNAPVDQADLDKRLAEWRQREADSLFNGR